MNFLLIVYTIFSLNAWSNSDILNESRVNKEIDAFAGFQISQQYISGNYLIYDCQRQAFICCSRVNFETCKERRQLAIRQNREILPCVPLDVFENTKMCIDQQIMAIEQKFDATFCQEVGQSF